MPKIVHLTTVHHPFDTRIFHKECQTLARAGYRTCLIAPHTVQEDVDGVQIVPLPRFEHRLARIIGGAWAIYRLALQQEAALYHFHDPELLPVGIALKLTTKACVIYDVHENFPIKIRAREWLPRPLGGLASWGIRLLESVAAVLLDGIVAATEHIAARFPAAKTRVVRNYPLLSMMARSSGEEREYEGNATLIYTGGYTNHRGLYEIVQALAHVRTPQARLLLLGRHTDRQAAEAVRGLPGVERVDYQGLVPYEEMYDYLNLAAIGLICNQPRHDYDLAQPNKLFEYMSAGLPVIASNFELWKEIVEGNNCGVTVDPTSPEQIAEAIDYLLNHPDLRRQMGANARRASRETYNWEHESQELLSLYREVLRTC